MCALSCNKVILVKDGETMNVAARIWPRTSYKRRKLVVSSDSVSDTSGDGSSTSPDTSDEEPLVNRPRRADCRSDEPLVHRRARDHLHPPRVDPRVLVPPLPPPRRAGHPHPPVPPPPAAIPLPNRDWLYDEENHGWFVLGFVPTPRTPPIPGFGPEDSGIVLGDWVDPDATFFAMLDRDNDPGSWDFAAPPAADPGVVYNAGEVDSMYIMHAHLHLHMQCV